MIQLPVKNPKPDIENFIGVIKNLKIPKRPPFAELLIDDEVLRTVGEDFLGLIWTGRGTDRESRRRYWDFVVKVNHALGYDFLWVWGSLRFPSKVRVSGIKPPESEGLREWAETTEGMIRTQEDLENYPWPVFDDECLWDYEYVSGILPDGMGMFVCNGDGFLEILKDNLLGYESMCLMLYDDPELVQSTLDRVGGILLDAHKKMLEIPKVAGIFIGDDMGYNGGTLFSPDYIKQSILPWHKKLAALAHEKDMLYLFHSCGDLSSIMDDLIDDVKIDAKHSFQDKCCNVIDFKKQFGRRVSVMGGVDVDALCRLDEADLRKYTRGILDACMDGGRYAFGSGNSIANYIPLKNYLIMLEEGYRYSG